MAIYEGWRIFRKILKHDLALDRSSDRQRMTLSGRRRRNCPALELPTCRRGGGHGCHSVVFRGDHHCDAVGGRSTRGNVVLILLIGLRQIRFEEIADVAVFDLIGDGQAKQLACMMCE